VAQVFASGKLTITGGIIGTAEYMSPEQAQGQRATKKSDLYSLGAVMYVMLTGQPPFRGKTTLEVIQKHKFGQYDKPSRYVDDLPRWVEEIVAQLLEKDPDKRPPDAYVLSRRLQDALYHYEGLQSEQTIATGEIVDPGAPTVAASETAGPQAAGVGTLMRDLVRAEIERSQRPSPLDRLLNNTWVLLILLVLVVAGGVALFRSQQLSPEERFQAGVELMSHPEGDGWLRARSEFFEPLIEADADRWRDDVEPHLQRIRAYELRNRLSGGRRRPSDGAVPPSEPERFLRLAGHYREIGDLARAEEVLVALTALLQGAADHADFYTVAKEQLEEVRLERAERGRQDEFLTSALERADRLATEGGRDEAVRVWESIVELYGTDAAAEEHVRQARARLAGN
jgi:serine/threonine-protein kinase